MLKAKEQWYRSISPPNSIAVRAASLCAQNSVIGQSFEHRRHWTEVSDRRHPLFNDNACRQRFLQDESLSPAEQNDLDQAIELGRTHQTGFSWFSTVDNFC